MGVQLKHAGYTVRTQTQLLITHTHTRCPENCKIMSDVINVCNYYSHCTCNSWLLAVTWCVRCLSLKFNYLYYFFNFYFFWCINAPEANAVLFMTLPTPPGYDLLNTHAERPLNVCVCVCVCVRVTVIPQMLSVKTTTLQPTAIRPDDKRVEKHLCQCHLSNKSILSKS